MEQQSLFKQTQEEKVIEKLNTDGVVTNFWAIQNYMLRLGAIICQLSKKGWVFKRQYGEGKDRKNFHYFLITKGQ